MSEQNSKLCALICEYNPFHRGHKYQLDVLHSLGYTVVCIMSGELVQRGGIPVADKYDRARAAACCGADIVLELPAPFCSLGARDFARAGVETACALGIGTLAFGCEDPERIRAAADALRGADGIILKKVREKKNLSYPRARQEYLSSLSDDTAILGKPNNILAVEYLLALPEHMEALPLKRSDAYESASELRAMTRGEMLASIPAEAARVFAGAAVYDADRLAVATVADLRKKSAAELEDIYDMNRSFACALINAAREGHTPEEIVSALRSRTYTDAKIRRAILNSYFGITDAQAHGRVEYTVLLALRKDSSAVFGTLAERSEIPVLTKTASRARVLSPSAMASFERASRIRDVLSLCADNPKTVRSPFII